MASGTPEQKEAAESAISAYQESATVV